MNKLRSTGFVKKLTSLTHILYYVCFFVIYNFCFYQTTMYNAKASTSTNSIIHHIAHYSLYLTFGMILLSFLLAFLSLFLDYKSKLDILYALILLVLSGVFLLEQRDFLFHRSTVASIIFLAVAAKGKSAKKITFMALCSGTFWLIASYVAAKAGVIENLIYRVNVVRHSFGSVYPTDFMCHVLCLALALFALRLARCNVIEYILLISLIYLDYKYVSAKIALICLITLLIGTIIYQLVLPLLNPIKRRTFYKWIRRFVGVLLGLSAILFAIASFYLAKHYDQKHIDFYDKHGLLSLKGRYELSSIAYEWYPVTYWGTDVWEQGFGGSTAEPDWYFALDISYIKIFFSYGKVMLFMLLSLFTVAQFKCYKSHKFYLMFILFVIALDSAVEHHFSNISYNTFLILAFADMDFDGKLPVLSDLYGRIKNRITQSNSNK